MLALSVFLLGELLFAVTAKSTLALLTLIFPIRSGGDLVKLSFVPIELTIEASVSNDIVVVSIRKRSNQHKLVSSSFYLSNVTLTQRRCSPDQEDPSFAGL